MPLPFVMPPTPFPAVLRPLRHILAATALLAAGMAAAALPAPVATPLHEAGIPAGNAAFFVQQVDAGKPLLAHNAERAMNPASTMKLLTAYAALELLGPAHTWKTAVLADAVPEAGRLRGNLYLRGGGDPALTVDRFWLLLRQLRGRGVDSIDGDLVLDRRQFRLPPHDPAAFDNQPLRPYNVGADALLLNFRSLRLTLQADPATHQVRVINETPAEGVRIDNRLAYADEACGDWREKLLAEVAGDTLILSGRFAPDCGEKPLALAPWPADRQVEQLFRALWRELGGSFAGRVREGETPPAARLLLTHESPPLAEVVRDMNKWSNNPMARQLLLALAPETPATPAAAQARLERWLAEKGVAGAVVDNGSGLSREERISAEGLGRLLLAAWKSPVMPEMIASLPIAGSDGTLKRRLQGSAATGRAHLKTGYIEGVRSIAGYVLDRQGRRWVVVGILNDPRMKNGSAALDALVRWVAER